MFIEDPGMSIVAIDPGGTTGVAVWDAYGKKLYVDQIDAGRGRRAREKIHHGFIESKRRRRAVEKVGKGASEMEVLDYIERGVVDVLCWVILAAGPHGVVICEDFILNWGTVDRPARSSGREGLSPVRIRVRLRAKMESEGYLNGDAWRTWDGFGIHGADGRGIKLSKRGAELTYLQRLSDVERWAINGQLDGEESVIWAGGGIKWINRLPGTRHWLSGGEKATIAWLRDNGMWMPSTPHGMDALMHLQAFSRKLGSEIRQKPERIWVSMDELRPGRISTKVG